MKREDDENYNKAAIYFDYNQPVITYATLQTVTENLYRIISFMIGNTIHALQKYIQIRLMTNV